MPDPKRMLLQGDNNNNKQRNHDSRRMSRKAWVVALQVAQPRTSDAVERDFSLKKMLTPPRPVTAA